MGTTNYGDQILSFDYKAPGKSEVFNRLNYKLIEKGIYDGGLLSYSDASHVILSPFTSFVVDSTTEIGVRIETQSSITIEVASGTPYIIGRFAWNNVENNYMDIIASTFGNILPDDIIFGRCIFPGGVLSSSFDYTRRTVPEMISDSIKNNELRVIPKEPATGEVYIYAGDVITSKGKISFAGGDSPTLTPTTLGRNDLVYIDKDGSIKVKEGEDNSTPVTPLYGDKIVLAEIHRGASASYISGDNIINIYNQEKYIKDDPWFDITEPDRYEDNIATVYEGTGELFELSSQVVGGSKGTTPNIVSYYRESTNYKFWNNRGSIKFDSNYENHLEYSDKAITNAMTLEFYIYPNWSYTIGDDVGIFDISMGNSDTDNFVKLIYNSTNDTLQLIVQDDASNYISSETSAFTSDVDLQKKLYIKVAWQGGDGSTSNVFFNVNGVNATNSTTGGGIANIDLTAHDGFVLGCSYPTTGKDRFASMWITDLLIENTYNIDTSHFTNDTYYIIEDRIMGDNTNFYIDKLGNIGAKNLYTENLFVGGSPIKNIHDVLDPIGTIKMFDAENAGGSNGGKSGVWEDNKTIPGWYACISGNNIHGCPDLTDKFVMGKVVAGSGATGGSNTHTITTSELPPHTHTANHDHSNNSASINQSASHTHNVTKTAYYGDSFPSSPQGYARAASSNSSLTVTSGTQSASHHHTITVNTKTMNTGDGGFSNTAIDTKPAYYSVIYIRKCY